jgi:hypothetical protein
LGTVTVKIDDYLKKEDEKVKINWSEYIREAVKRRIEIEEKREAAEKLLEGLRVRKHTAPSGFINETIREMREFH